MNWLTKISSEVKISNEAFPPQFSPDLVEEIEYRMEQSEELRLETAPFIFLYMIVNDILDSEIIPKWRKSIYSWMIDLGVFREISPEEMSDTLVSDGKKYDFRMNNKFYIFNKHPEGYL